MRLVKMLAAIVVISGIFSNSSIAAESKKIVMVVNGVNLKEADLNQEIQILMPQATSYHSGISSEKLKSVIEKAKVALLEKELKYQDALAKGLKLNEEELQSEIAIIKARYKNKEQFDKIVADSGYTPETFKILVERNILAKKVKVETVDKKITVTQESAKKYYESNPSRYVKPQDFRASQILVKIDPSATIEDKKKLRAKAELILNKIHEGADFSQLAENESDDMSSIKKGDLGYFHEGQTIPEFDDAVKLLKIGEVSGIVESMYGLHIIKLTDKRQARQIPFEEVKEKIFSDFREKEEKILYNQWMDNLKAKAIIVYPTEG
jgi:parvulin-like peptidyl-prolyl isomerase